LTPTKVNLRSTSRLKVQVEFRERTSISPEASAVKRVSPVVGVNSTFEGSLRIAAASARQTATSKPSHWPLASGAAKPARPVLSVLHEFFSCWAAPSGGGVGVSPDLCFCEGTQNCPTTVLKANVKRSSRTAMLR
jgi:hypothetical protein